VRRACIANEMRSQPARQPLAFQRVLETAVLPAQILRIVQCSVSEWPSSNSYVSTKSTDPISASGVPVALILALLCAEAARGERRPRGRHNRCGTGSLIWPIF
jgi:hypothetical protein